MEGLKNIERKLLSDEDCRLLIDADKSQAMEASRLVAKIIKSLPPISEHSDVKPLVYIVGGYVRDLILGLQPKDIDIQVYGVMPSDLEVVINSIFPGKVQKLGKSFEILKVELDDSSELDISIARQLPKAFGDDETKESLEKFEFGDPFISPKLAASLKDFSINNLALDPLSSEIFDWYGARRDLRDGVLRLITDSIMYNKPVNILRAVQFSARFILEPDENCYEVMKEVVSSGKLLSLHPRLVRQEFEKFFLKGVKPSVGFNVAKKSGLFDNFLLGFYDALDEAGNFENLINLFDLIKSEDILSSVSQKRQFLFLNSIVIYGMEEDKRYSVGLYYLEKIALKGRLSNIVFSLIEAIDKLPDLFSNIKQLDSPKAQSQNKVKSRIPGIKVKPVSQLINVLELKTQNDYLNDFLNFIKPFTWSEFYLFSCIVKAPYELELEFINNTYRNARLV